MPIIAKSMADEALEEASQLLNGLQIPAGGRGARAQGKLVSLSIDDEPGREPGTREIIVRCFVPGKLNVPWDGWSFFVADRMASLDRNGEVRLTLQDASEQPLPIEAARACGKFAEIPALARMDDDERPFDPARQSAKPVTTTYITADGKLTATVTRYPDSVVQIEFRTLDRRLGHGAVVIEFVGADGSVLGTRELIFHEAEGWIAWFEGPLIFGQAISIRFAVKPPRGEQAQ